MMCFASYFTCCGRCFSACGNRQNFDCLWTNHRRIHHSIEQYFSVLARCCSRSIPDLFFLLKQTNRSILVFALESRDLKKGDLIAREPLRFCRALFSRPFGNSVEVLFILAVVSSIVTSELGSVAFCPNPKDNLADVCSLE